MITNSSLYNFLRYSALSNSIVELLTGKTATCKKFYASFLLNEGAGNKPNRLAFDIGANKGNKTAALLDLGFRVIGLEPEKKSLSTLNWRFAKDKRVTIIDKGVSDQPGVTSIFISGPRSGLNTMSSKWVDVLKNPAVNRWGKKFNYQGSYEVSLTTLNELVTQFGVPYFIKIDVEGYEHKVIKGLNHQAAFISFETNLPEFLEETIECIKHISTLSGNTVFNYSFTEALVSEHWLSAEEMIGKINDPAIRYMEIICKLQPNDA